MTTAFRETVRGLLRERILDAAQDLLEEQGWSSVTMSKVAATVGVSRQTVHTEVGTKHGLAQELALRELQRFLDVVRSEMAGETELVSGVRAACRAALELAETSLLVRTIVGSSPQEQDQDFLRILTTESGEIVAGASAVVKQAIVDLYPPPLSGDQLDVAVEAVVRLVLSQMTRPGKAPDEVAADIAWLVGSALAGAESAAG